MVQLNKIFGVVEGAGAHGTGCDGHGRIATVRRVQFCGV
jgi:hypothetical protein